jgi:hypothetical protein
MFAQKSQNLYIVNFVDEKSLKNCISPWSTVNVYSCADQTNHAKFVVKQKQAIRVVYGANYREHTKAL